MGEGKQRFAELGVGKGASLSQEQNAEDEWGAVSRPPSQFLLLRAGGWAQASGLCSRPQPHSVASPLSGRAACECRRQPGPRWVARTLPERRLAGSSDFQWNSPGRQPPVPRVRSPRGSRPAGHRWVHAFFAVSPSRRRAFRFSNKASLTRQEHRSAEEYDKKVIPKCDVFFQMNVIIRPRFTLSGSWSPLSKPPLGVAAGRRSRLRTRPLVRGLAAAL